MWAVLFSVWFKCFIISWSVSALWCGLSTDKYEGYGSIRTILYYLLWTALLGLVLSFLVFGGLIIAAFVCKFFLFIF